MTYHHLPRGPYGHRRVGTIFLGETFVHYDWSTRKRLREYPLKALNLGVPTVTAAVVNPLDSNLVWVFHEATVLDVRVRECDVVARGPASAHPVFKVLPASAVADLVAVITDDPDVLGRGARADRLYAVTASQLHELRCVRDVGAYGTLSDGTASGVLAAFTGVLGASVEIASVAREVKKGDGVETMRDALGGEIASALNGVGPSERGRIILCNEKRWASVSLVWGAAQQVFSSSAQPFKSGEMTERGVSAKRVASVPVQIEPLTHTCAALPKGRVVFHVIRSKDPPARVEGVIPGARAGSMDPASALRTTLPTGGYFDAETGDGRTDKVSPKSEVQPRETAIIEAIFAGNVPDFLRTFVAARAVHRRTVSGREMPPSYLVFYVMPEYLSIGSASDFVRVPLTGYGAQQVADRYDCTLPTGKLLHDIWYEGHPQRLPFFPLSRRPKIEALGGDNAIAALADAELAKPASARQQGLAGGVTVTSTDEQLSTATFYWEQHLLEAWRRQHPTDPSRLSVGARKEVVTSSKINDKTLVSHEGRGLHLAFYGAWTESAEDPLSRRPVQGGHDRKSPEHPHKLEGFLDYAQGVRLVHRRAYLKLERASWREVDLLDIYADPELHKLASVDVIAAPRYQIPPDARVPQPEPAPLTSNDRTCTRR